MPDFNMLYPREYQDTFDNSLPANNALVNAMFESAYRPAPYINQMPTAMPTAMPVEQQPSFGRQLLAGLARAVASPQFQALSAQGTVPRFFGSTLSDVGRAQSDWYRGLREVEIARERNQLAAAQEANRQKTEQFRNQLLEGELQQRKAEGEAERMLRERLDTNRLSVEREKIKAAETLNQLLGKQPDPKIEAEKLRIAAEETWRKADELKAAATKAEADKKARQTKLATLADSVVGKNTGLTGGWGDKVWSEDWERLALAIRSADLPTIDALAKKYPDNLKFNSVVIDARNLLSGTVTAPVQPAGDLTRTDSGYVPPFLASPPAAGPGVTVPSGVEPATNAPAGRLRVVRDPVTGRMVFAP